MSYLNSTEQTFSRGHVMTYGDTKRESCDFDHRSAGERGGKVRHSKNGGDHDQLENTGMRPRDFRPDTRLWCAYDAGFGNPSLMPQEAKVRSRKWTITTK